MKLLPRHAERPGNNFMITGSGPGAGRAVGYQLVEPGTLGQGLDSGLMR